MIARRTHRLVSCAFVVAAFVSTVSAQNVPIPIVHPVTVGAMTRDAGVYNLWVGPKDLPTIQAVNKYLVLLESDLAESVSSMRVVSATRTGPRPSSCSKKSICLQGATSTRPPGVSAD